MGNIVACYVQNSTVALRFTYCFLSQQAYHATTVIRQMQKMALSSGGGRSPTPQRSVAAQTSAEACGGINGAQDK